MIDQFESTVRLKPDRVFFTFVDSAGREHAYTYRQTRLIASTLAMKLHATGVRSGGRVVIDLPNGPAWVFFLLAAAYGSFTLVALNQRLTEAEKTTRLTGLKRGGDRIDFSVDEALAGRLVASVCESLDGGGAGGTARASALPGSSTEGAGRVIMGAQQDAIEESVHFAERAAHLFDAEAQAVIMFTSGTTGHPKAVALTWKQFVGSARASNRALSSRGEGSWQAVLPFFHIGGLQVLVRSIANATPLVVYERFDAERVLNDAETFRVTHISVVDKMLQDLAAVEEARGKSGAEGLPGGAGVRGAGNATHGSAVASRDASQAQASRSSRLSLYRCILLGGGALNPQTIERAYHLGARVYASYGMTETSSQIANSLIDQQFTGGLKLLDGYEARIVEPDVEGFGRLAVQGPGVFDGYLNARAAFTVDGFFLTGDVAALHRGQLYLKERTSDMFVSGGENVYPAEVVRTLRRIEGVSDAHVFGVPDATWGRRPAAVVERSREGVQPEYVKRAAQPSLSKISMPQAVLVVDQLPRSGIGKVDRAATEALFEQRLQVERVVLHRIRLPFRAPFKTAKATLDHRDAIIVEVVDHTGRTGLGECVAFETDWYLPETLGDDETFLRDVLAPYLRGRLFAHPREAADAFMQLSGAREHPMAVAAVETALWDLHGRITGAPLWQLIDEEHERLCAAAGPAGKRVRALPRAASIKGSRALVSAGAVVGMGAPADVVAAVHEAVRAGYRRVKMKIAPGQGPSAVRAVREAYPALLITLDANQSFSAHDVEELRAYDDLDIGWIEEPIDVRRPGFDGRSEAIERLERLQRTFSTPICVDESFVNAADAERILRYPDLRCVCVKVAKFGGIEPALRFIVRAQSRGCEVWMGGMYDTGVSKRMHAAFEVLPGVIVPGDVGSTARYFDVDVTDPPYAAVRGCVLLNAEGHETGVGCALNLPALAKALVRRTEV
ncbi:MAG: AMP-binding protein [Eggerthellaceae bacterium]|nr:AMP-binding protein [Eggerthellaceae bacterium]